MPNFMVVAQLMLQQGGGFLEILFNLQELSVE
jgi:hypothetical protein